MQLFAFLSLFGKEIRAILLIALFAYLGLAALCLRSAARSGRSEKEKMVNVCVVLFLFVILPVGLLVNISRDGSQSGPARAERSRPQSQAANYGGSKAAYARLEDLCKSSGEFIYRTAENVEGVFLMKLRPTSGPGGDKWAEDPFGDYNDGGTVRNGICESYLHAFLNPLSGRPPYPYFSYVDLISPVDGKRYRYTGRIVPVAGSDRGDFQLERTEVTPDMPLPRYGVTFDDITEHADRERWWIAGSSLRIIDLETDEVMGERIGYMMPSWLGGRSLAESYGWLTSMTGCPYEPKPETSYGVTTMVALRNFIRNVIQPINKGEAQ